MSAIPAETLQYARDYASRGWAVFPVHPPKDGQCGCGRPECKDVGKHPATIHGFNDATTNDKTIRRWWTEYPAANIGIKTGQGSDLLVIDIDPRNYGDIVFQLLVEKYGPMPVTPVAISGSGGRHYYLTWTDVKSGVHALGPGVDILADGKYVVAPPSLHTSRGLYEWEMGTYELNPAEVPSWVRKVRNEVARGSRPHNPKGYHASSSTPTSEVVHPGTAGTNLRGFIPDLACAHQLGLEKYAKDLQPGQGSLKFHCIIHPDKSPSASLFRTASGDILYRDWHEAEQETWYTLPEVRASRAYGVGKKFRGNSPEHAVWRLRLLYEAGGLMPVEVLHRELPSGTSPAVESVYQGFLLLLGLKWAVYQKGEPATFSWRFGAAWCGVSEWNMRESMPWLMKHGYVEDTGKHRGSFGKEITLLQPVTPINHEVSLEDARDVQSVEWRDSHETEHSGTFDANGDTRAVGKK